MNDMLKTTPDFSTEAAAGLLADHFGLSGRLSPLASERDQNFKVETADGTFILKIVNAGEPEVESDFQTALLAHIGAHAGDLPVPHIRPTLAGESLARTTGENGASHRIRLVSWVDGQPLARTALARRPTGHQPQGARERPHAGGVDGIELARQQGVVAHQAPGRADQAAEGRDAAHPARSPSRCAGPPRHL